MGGVVKAIKNVIKKTVDFVVDTIKTVEGFAANIAKGVIKSIVGMAEGVIEGDWTKFRDSFVNAFQTAVYVMAVFTENALLIAAAVVALDGLHNDGQLTTFVVTTLGKAEREVFGTENILENVEIITASIIILGSLYAGIEGFGVFLADISGISSLLNAQYLQVGLGIYSITDAYMQFQDANDLYDELMKQYQAWLETVNQKIKAFNEMWDAVYGDPDLLYEVSAGGSLFNAGAGSDEYSVSTIHEQSTYLLGLDHKRDVEFDRYFHDPMDIDYVNLNIEDTKPEILRYKT